MDIDKSKYNINIIEKYIESVNKAEEGEQDPLVQEKIKGLVKQLRKEKEYLEAETKRGKFGRLIRALGGAIKRIFVKEQSFEERITNTFMKIYPYISPQDRSKGLQRIEKMPLKQKKRLADEVAKMAQAYRGGWHEGVDKIPLVQELMVGIGGDGDINRYSKIEIGGEQIVRPNAVRPSIVDVLVVVKSVVNDDNARRVLLNFAHEGLLGVDIKETLQKNISTVIGLPVTAGVLYWNLDPKDRPLADHKLSIFRDVNDQIHLKFETGFYIHNKALGALGAAVASREVVIPENELEALGAYFAEKDAELETAAKNFLKDKEVPAAELRKQLSTLKKVGRKGAFENREEVAKLTPGLRVIDSYSRVVGLENGLLEAYQEAVKDLERKQ